MMKHRVTRAALSLIAGALACLALPAAAQAQAQREGSAKAEVRTLDDARDIIREARRITSPNGIEELRAVEIGGIKQWISVRGRDRRNRSEEHTSELQSLMRISYAVFCLNKKNKT